MYVDGFIEALSVETHVVSEKGVFLLYVGHVSPSLTGFLLGESLAQSPADRGGLVRALYGLCRRDIGPTVGSFSSET